MSPFFGDMKFAEAAIMAIVPCCSGNISRFLLVLYWFFFFQEDSLQFFKEEKSDGAVYHHYLKKVRYHTASEDVGILPGAGEGNSTFYRNFGASIRRANKYYNLSQLCDRSFFAF